MKNIPFALWIMPIAIVVSVFLAVVMENAMPVFMTLLLCVLIGLDPEAWKTS